MILPRMWTQWEPCRTPLSITKEPCAFFEGQSRVLNLTERWDGSLVPDLPQSRPESPFSDNSEDEVPEEIWEALSQPSYNDLSSVKDLKIIHTSFDPAKPENTHVKFNASNKKDRFRYTAELRRSAERGFICNSEEIFEEKVDEQNFRQVSPC